MKVSAVLVLSLTAILVLASFGVVAKPAAALVAADDCPNASGDFNFAKLATAEPGLQSSFTQSGNTFTFSVTTPTAAGQGVIEYCVYPTDASGNPTGVIPVGTTWNIPPPPATCTPPAAWKVSGGNSSGYVGGVRDHGTDVIPYNGATTCALTVNWGSSVGHFQIVLHVLDATLCKGELLDTCYVIPNGSSIFPPPPPPPGVPQFPLGTLLLVAVAIPALLLVRRRQLVA